MRVIAGSARRIPLKTTDGLDIRPTTDRIKETLFNMVQNRLIQSSFLDCFAGSGAIGIEALSRGASKAVFIDKNQKAVQCIHQNLNATHLDEKALVMNCDILAGLKHLEDKKFCFDTVFMDPPYRQNWEYKVLEYLQNSRLIHEESLILVEASLDTDFSYIEELGFFILKEKRYKTNQHIFLKKNME